MAIFYKIYQNNNPKSTKKGLWFARAVTTGTVTTDDLAKIMERNCTCKASDIKAVLTELAETMADQLQMSKRVKLNGIGSFKISLRSNGSDTAKDFSEKDVKGLRLLFRPESHRSTDEGYVVNFVNGAKVTEMPKNTVSKE